MLSAAEVLQELEGKGLRPVGLPIVNPDKPNSYLIFLKRTYDKDGNAVPSKRKMDIAIKHMVDRGVVVNVALLDEKASDLDKAVAALLAAEFPASIQSSVVSLENSEGLISINLSEGVEDSDITAMEQAVTEFLGLHGIVKLNFIFSTPRPTATVTAFISMLRKHAPVSLEELGQRLVDGGFEQPTEAWMNRAFDRWRKKGVLFRRPDGRFILTSAGLKQVGTKRGRTSPDVTRALAAARQD